MLFCEQSISAPTQLYSIRKFNVTPPFEHTEDAWPARGMYAPIFEFYLASVKREMSADALNQTATLLSQELFRKKYTRRYLCFKHTVEDPLGTYSKEIIGISFSVIWEQARRGDVWFEKGKGVSLFLGRELDYMALCSPPTDLVGSKLVIDKELTIIYQTECQHREKLQTDLKENLS